MHKKAGVLVGLLCGLIPSFAKAQQATATEVYGLRERCGKLAATVYDREYSPHTRTTATGGQQIFNYENHYSQKLNRCFYLEISTFIEKGTVSTSWRLYDINENKEYGHYWQSGTSKFVDCIVGEVRCLSEDEFRNLAKPYLED